MTDPVVFHPLLVAEIERLTPDAVAVTLAVPEELTDIFRFLPGQHLTLRTEINGEDVRRTYSICTNSRTGVLRVGIRQLSGGLFSTYANTQLKAGEVLQVLPPIGDFVLETGPADNSPISYGAVVGGSGITPVLSMLSSSLPASANNHWTLLYGNRTARSAMFAEELGRLKDRYPDRLQLINVFSREETSVPLFSGRLNREKLVVFFERLVNPTAMAGWYLCGPRPMVETAQSLLLELGVPEKKVHFELFYTGPPPADQPRSRTGEDIEAGPVELRFVLDQRETVTRMRAEDTVLDAALVKRPELPFSCKGGMCATCKARLLEGEVHLDKNYALTEAELARGYILTCQAHPVVDRLVVDYDQR